MSSQSARLSNNYNNMMRCIFKNILFFFLTGILLSGCGLQAAMAQQPAWIVYEGRETFPEKEYITGFAEGKKNRKESLEEFEKKVVNQARSELLEKISLSVRSTTIYVVSRKDGNVDETYNQQIDISTGPREASFPVIYYYDKKARTGYAIAYLNKKKTLKRIESMLKRYTNDLETTLKEADLLMGKGQLGASFQQYISAGNIVSEMKKLNTEYKYFNNGLPAQNGRYNLLDITNIINRKINYLKKQPAGSPEQLVNLVYINMADLKLNPDMPVYVDDFLFEESGNKTQFSNILKDMMLVHLKNLMGNDVIGFNPRFDHYKLSGKYRIADPNLNVLFKLESYENDSQSPVHFFRARISESCLRQDRIEYTLPGNIKDKTWNTDSLNDKEKQELFNINGLYIDRSGALYQYIRIKNFEPVSEDEVLLDAIFMKGGLMEDIQIKLNLKRKEVTIPRLGKGKIHLNSGTVYFYSYPGTSPKFKFIKTDDYEN